MQKVCSRATVGFLDGQGDGGGADDVVVAEVTHFAAAWLYHCWCCGWIDQEG
jgi:hypothetical protein